VAAGGLGLSEFSHPDDVLAVLPRDPYEQLDLARRITMLAVAGQVTELERELGRLRKGAAETYYGDEMLGNFTNERLVYREYISKKTL
jgi:hypothetical protein